MFGVSPWKWIIGVVLVLFLYYHFVKPHVQSKYEWLAKKLKGSSRRSASRKREVSFGGDELIPENDADNGDYSDDEDDYMEKEEQAAEEKMKQKMATEMRKNSLPYKLYETYAAIGDLVTRNQVERACTEATLLGNAYRDSLTKNQFVQMLTQETNSRFAPADIVAMQNGFDQPINAAMSLSRNPRCATQLKTSFLGI